jgi:cell division septum initiation protein DivIVA
MGDEPLKIENERLLAENRLLLDEIKRLEREIEYMEMSGFQPVRRTRNRNEED